MRLKIDHKLITTPIDIILNTARSELTNGKLKDIRNHGRNILITCPCHKGGLESKPSCFVLNTDDDEEVEQGYAHCFTCGYAEPLPQVIADLFDKDIEFGKDWLCDRFCTSFVSEEDLLPAIELEPVLKTPPIMDETELLNYDYYHPYMWERKLTKEVVDEFRVGYDPARAAITFPVYDEKHRLRMVTARSVTTKRFYISEGVDKPVYLLYDLIEKGITTAYVCESQINTLTLRGYGYPAIGLFGTGSKTQLETLRNSGIRNYILCFDGDFAGRKGAKRFKKAMRNDVFITDVVFPQGTDVNSISKEDFENLLRNS